MLKSTELEKFYGDNAYRPPNRLLQWRAKIYLKQILHHLTIDKNTPVLEIGCNHGYLTELLATLSTSVIGVDINHSIIRTSNKKYLKVMDACDLKFPDHSLDLIVSTHTIEHIPDTLLFFREMTRVLKKDGHIILIYPWEPVRGYTLIPEIFTMKRSFKECRKIHIHAFTPFRIKSILSSPLFHKAWNIFFVPQPNFISVIQKIE